MRLCEEQKKKHAKCMLSVEWSGKSSSHNTDVLLVRISTKFRTPSYYKSWISNIFIIPYKYIGNHE